MKYLLITSIKTKLSEKDVLKIARERKNYFLKVRGLIRKLWTKDEETRIFHGIFEFVSKKRLEDYLKTDFASSVGRAYRTMEPAKIQILSVQKEQGRLE